MMTERQRIVRACRRIAAHPGFGRTWFDVVEVLRHLLNTPTPLAVLEEAFPGTPYVVPFEAVRHISMVLEPLPLEPLIEVGQTWVCVMADGGFSRLGMHVTVERMDGDTVRLSGGYGTSPGGLRLYFDLVPALPDRQETTMATRTENSGPWWTSPESVALARWVLAEQRFRDPEHLTGAEIKALGRAANNYPSHLMEKGWGGDCGTWNERAVCVLETIMPPVVGQRWACTRGWSRAPLHRVLKVGHAHCGGGDHVELYDESNGAGFQPSLEEFYRHFRRLGPDETFSVTPKGTFLSATQACGPVDAGEIPHSHATPVNPPDTRGKGGEVSSAPLSADIIQEPFAVAKGPEPLTGYAAAHAEMLGVTPEQYRAARPEVTMGRRARRQMFARRVQAEMEHEQYGRTDSMLRACEQRKDVDLSMSRGATRRTVGRDLPYDPEEP